MPGRSGKTVAYVRVSSAEQNAGRQHDAVGQVDRTFEDRISGKSRAERTALKDLLDYIRDGDTVRVASMDRLARSLTDLKAIVDEVIAVEASIQFVKEGITFAPDSSDPFVTFQLHILGAVAELERNLIRERQAEGIALAKAQGRYRGSRPKLTEEKVQQARQLIANGVPKAQVARDLGVSRQTLYDALRR